MGVLTDEMKRVVAGQRLGYVATVSADGTPNVSPKGSLAVWDDDHLVFADIESPRTIRNLASNPNTEINVVDPFSRKGFRFRGTAEIIRTGATYWKILERYRREGADVRRVRSIALVRIQHAAPLASPVYLTGLTEEEVRRLWEEFYVKSLQKTVADLIPPNDF